MPPERRSNAYIAGTRVIGGKLEIHARVIQVQSGAEGID